MPASRTGWPAHTNLVIAFARPGSTSWHLGGGVVGSGGVLRSVLGTDRYGQVAAIQRSGVVLDAAYGHWRRGFGPGNSRGKALLHELGHAVGLGHTAAHSQVMYPVIGRPDRYGAGDLAGLRRLGQYGGCVRSSGLARPSTRSVSAP